MGFWQTGYMEFHEEAGLGGIYVPSKPVYACHQCGASFASLDDLRHHRFTAHPHRQPALVVRGEQLGANPVTVTEPLHRDEVFIEEANSVHVNGARMSPNELIEFLVRQRNDVARGVLGNGEVRVKFEIRFEVAEDAHLQGVELAFDQLVRGRKLNGQSIEAFIMECTNFPTAAFYCDGICSYLYGVLAKEGDSRIAGEQEYLQRYNQAIAKLQLARRPLARTLRAIVAFHFNHFAEAASLSPASRLGLVSMRLARWIRCERVDPGALDSFEGLALERLLTDADTEQVLAWSAANVKESASRVSEIAAYAEKKGIATYDEAKLRVLLAEILMVAGEEADAKHHARVVVNRLGFERWAENMQRKEASR